MVPEQLFVGSLGLLCLGSAMRTWQNTAWPAPAGEEGVELTAAGRVFRAAEIAVLTGTGVVLLAVAAGYPSIFG